MRLLHGARSYFLVTQQQTRRPSLLLTIDGTDRQTDGSTPERYIDPTPYTMLAASVNNYIS